jgi:hypothetical protein
VTQVCWEETTGGAINRSTLKSRKSEDQSEALGSIPWNSGSALALLFLLKIAALALRRALNPLGSPMLYSRSNS